MFQTERATIYTRLLEGRYPPYRDILSLTRRQTTKKIPLPVQAFLSRVRQAAIMTDDESKRVDFTFGSGKLQLRARGEARGNCHVEMVVDRYDGDEVCISFDPAYMTDFLRVLDPATDVILEMSTPGSAALFKAGDDYSVIVMPLAG
jgi:DNA polymerase III subunit beta